LLFWRSARQSRYFFCWAQPRKPVDQRAPAPASEVSARAPVVAESQISYPIPTDQAQDSESLPKLEDSDTGHVKVHRQNGVRYAAYVRCADAVDTKKLVDLYARFYPLFQQPYEELGYPKAYFNDRLVSVIDDLLAAPELKDAPRLVQPKVMYEFADAELEALSARRKIMIRMGSANAVRIKAKLRAMRAELVGLSAQRPR
jgi:hypothetical protein